MDSIIKHFYLNSWVWPSEPDWTTSEDVKCLIKAREHKFCFRFDKSFPRFERSLD